MSRLCLKKIELVGFNSFADRTILQFEEGVTAIVGPNGCGKSNVADAFRWVMGEQSAKSLRGEKMLDVLFAGTSKRKGAPYCEVALTFNNADGSLPLPYAEIVISRRLTRKGDSDYRINGSSVRLKDIHAASPLLSLDSGKLSLTLGSPLLGLLEALLSPFTFGVLDPEGGADGVEGF